MQVQVKIDGMDVLMPWMRQAPRRVDLAIARAMTQAGYEARKEIVGKEGLSKYGRHKAYRKENGKWVWNYPNPATGQPWSPAGDVPTQVTAKLRTQTRAFSSVRHGFGSYTKEVGPTMVYARVQEEGAQVRNPRTGKIMTIPARPYVKPAFDRLQTSGVVERIFETEITKAVTF
jgi:hypothetical protein